MSVYKYKTKKGERWYVKIGNTTKRGFKKKSDAKNYEKLLSMKSETPERFMSFFDVIHDYLENGNKNVTYGTYAKKEVVCRNIIIPNTKDKNIYDIDELDCRSFRNKVESLKYSTEYRNYILRVYKSIFIHAKKYYKLKNPPTYVLDSFQSTFEEKLKKKEKEMHVWSNDEFKKFIQYVDRKTYKAFFTVLFQTGLRLGEIQALTWNDYQDGLLNINKSLTPKTNKGAYEIKEPKTASSVRKVALGDNLNSYLKNYKETQEKIPGFDTNWFIFGGINPLPSTSITRIKDNAIKQAGLIRISIHEFRHSHASNLISAGMNIVAVSRRLGHSNIEMTLNRYTHLMQENEKQVIEYLDKSSQNLLKK